MKKVIRESVRQVWIQKSGNSQRKACEEGVKIEKYGNGKGMIGREETTSKNTERLEWKCEKEMSKHKNIESD